MMQAFWSERECRAKGGLAEPHASTAIRACGKTYDII